MRERALLDTEYAFSYTTKPDHNTQASKLTLAIEDVLAGRTPSQQVKYVLNRLQMGPTRKNGVSGSQAA